MNSSNGSIYYKPFSMEKIEEAIQKSGLKKTAFEMAIGHSSGYLHHCIKRKSIKTSDIALIKALYDVDIELKEPIKKENSTIKEEPNINLHELIEIFETIKKRSGATNIILKDSNQAISQKLDNIQKQNGEIINTLHTIGNLLTQINEKIYKGAR